MESNELLKALEGLKKELENVKSASEQVDLVVKGQNQFTKEALAQADAIKRSSEAVVALTAILERISSNLKEEYLPSLDQIVKQYFGNAAAQLIEATSSLDASLTRIEGKAEATGKQIKAAYLKDLSKLVQSYMKQSADESLSSIQKSNEASKALLSLQNSLPNELKENIGGILQGHEDGLKLIVKLLEGVGAELSIIKKATNKLQSLDVTVGAVSRVQADMQARLEKILQVLIGLDAAIAKLSKGQKDLGVMIDAVEKKIEKLSSLIESRNIAVIAMLGVSLLMNLFLIITK